MKHQLHKKVGVLLKEYAKQNGFEAILDSACEDNSKRHVSLFSSAKSHKIETRLCCVDAMLLKDGKVAVVIEIEETGFLPTKICGKYLTTALSRAYNREGKLIVMKEKSVNFIQILDTSSLAPSSRKPKQFENIKEAINNNPYGCVKSYDVVYINKEKDSGNLKKKLYDILMDI